MRLTDYYNHYLTCLYGCHAYIFYPLYHICFFPCTSSHPAILILTCSHDCPYPVVGMILCHHHLFTSFINSSSLKSLKFSLYSLLILGLVGGNKPAGSSALGLTVSSVSMVDFFPRPNVCSTT